ncbi:testis-specific gene 10 protein-like isoform X2 [Lineus longissimus]|uniref:testis-specific gene 10 protein-like isoform X2 n=1 Tax=Lineus longissimus TaxID=88925 RepID=UPI002B4D26F2
MDLEQVDGRDSEIDRLNKMLEGGRPYDVVSLEARNKSNERLISHLNIQIDYLQQRNRDLERQLTELRTVELESTSQRIDLDVKNKTLETELVDVDRLAKNLQDEKDMALERADREVNVSRLEMEKSRRELDDLELQLEQMRAEKVRTSNECGDVQIQLAAVESDYQKLEDLLNKVQDDKRKLSLRVNRLTSNERELVMEIERLKTRNGVKKRAKSPNRMDSFIKSLEDERDYWKGEVDVLQKLLKMESRTPTRCPGSPKKSTPTKKGTSNMTRSRSSTPSKSGKNKTCGHYDAILKVLEEERDYYKREYEMARALRHHATSPSRSPPTRDRSSDDGDVQRLTRERDELQSLLDKFERHMAEIQGNVKVLTAERDNINSMYEEAKEDLMKLRREVVKSPKSPKVSLAAQAVLRRVESERDDALIDLRRVQTDRDSLRERLKIATESQLTDRARLEQRVEDLENNLRIVEAEREDYAARVGSLKEMMISLEDQLKNQSMSLAETREESSQNKATATQMRLLTDQAERSLDEQQRRLARKESELRTANEKYKILEDRMSDMSRINQDTRDEVSRLRATIGALDREKDSLQTMVDDKTERLAMLEDDVKNKDQSLSDLQITCSSLETRLSQNSESISQREREILSLRRQVDAVTADLSEASHGKEAVLRENRRLQEDLSLMTKENQALNCDLDDVVNEREDFKVQVQDYVNEVKRVEDLLSEKEQERTDLLDQYRALSLEADKYQTQTHQLESEGSNLKLELMTKDSEVRRLRDKMDGLDKDLQDTIHSQQAYEIQVSNLTRSVAALEENLREADDERQNLLQDLAAVRDLCSKLECDKESYQRQLTAKSLDLEQLQNMVEDAKSEVSVVKSQMQAERSSNKNLESLLQSNREKEFKVQLTTQEKDAEINMLRERLQLNEARLENQNRELSSLRTRNLETETEIEHLRRQLTSERFERERTIQEMRRQGMTPPLAEYRSKLNTSGYSARSPLSPARRSPTPSSARHQRTPERPRSPYSAAKSFLDDDLTSTSQHYS